jgi:DNA replication initiation complex subunit (GINS family)
MRDYPEHDDLGLDPESDRTEDLRPTKNAPGRCANTAEGLQNNSPATTNEEL